MVILEAPVFDGLINPWSLINCVDDMDKFFDHIDLSNAKKVLSR